MTLDEDILAFEMWATKMGFPQKSIPSREALKSIFKSPQRDVFCNMMERVKPRQEVREIRENILIRKMDKLKDQVVPACSRSFLPKEMQRYLKIKDLNNRKEELDKKISQQSAQYTSLANSIKTKNMQTIKLNQKFVCLRAKVNMLDVKRESLKKEVEKEETNKSRVIATMPVKLTSQNANESVAAAAVEEAFNELEGFYTLILNNSNPHIIQEAKDDMWKKMRKIFTNIPNFLIFNSILKVKEEQLQNIMTLNKKPLLSQRENLSAFEIKLMKAKAALLGVVANYISARQESYAINQRFVSVYTKFVEAVQCKVSLFNVEADDDTDEIISNYIVQYNTRSFNKGQNDYILSQIDLCKAQIKAGSKQLEDHEILLNSIKRVYSDIDSSINRIHYEVLQLHQMKEKILFSKNMLQHHLGEMQMERTNFMLSTMKINDNSAGTAGENSTFDITGGNFFSSTKLDFDSTLNSSNALRSGDITVMPAGAQGRHLLPPVLTELCTFMETPFEKFSCVTKECAFYLAANPLITESQELSSTIQLAPGVLLTPDGSLQEVMSRVAWSDAISDISSELRINSIAINGVNLPNLQAKAKHQREDLAELLDKIELVNINTNRLFKKATKYYDFLLKNPPRNYIPPTKRLHNQTYLDYESEYHTYYRMVSKGSYCK